MNPLDLRGPEFLQLYACCFGAALVVSLIARALIRRSVQDFGQSGAQLDVYDVAYIAGGPVRALQVGVIALVERGQLKISDGGAIRLGHDTAARLDGNALERAIRAEVSKYGTTFRSLRASCRGALSEIDERLASAGYIVPANLRTMNGLLTALLCGSVMLLGFAKMFVGISRNRPVMLLVVELIVSLVIAIIVAKIPMRRAPAGDRVLRSQLPLENQFPDTADVDRGLIMSLALVGASSLSGTEYHDLRRHLREESYSSGGDWGGSSCGSSCGGGGGCGGGGCGGGGCGGCGGG